MDFGLRWCDGGTEYLPALSPPTGLNIHFSASSHLEGRALPLGKGSSAPPPAATYLLLECAGCGTRSELQPFWERR